MNVGGIVRNLNTITITNSFNIGDARVGGIAGSSSYDSAILTIINTYNKVDIRGSDVFVGGLVGFPISTLAITNSYNKGEAIGSNFVGGFVGSVTKGYIYCSINHGEVKTNKNTTNIGGILGNIPKPYDEEFVYHTGEVYNIEDKVEGLDFGERLEDITIFTEKFLVESTGWEEDSIVLMNFLLYLESLTI